MLEKKVMLFESLEQKMMLYREEMWKKQDMEKNTLSRCQTAGKQYCSVYIVLKKCQMSIAIVEQKKPINKEKQSLNVKMKTISITN